MTAPERLSPEREAVRAIIADLSDRRGLDNAWDSIDDDIRTEIEDRWAALVAAAFAKEAAR